MFNPEREGPSPEDMGLRPEQPEKKSALAIAQAAYKTYEAIHGRFEAGDESVSEHDVDSAYKDYLKVHNKGAGEEGYEPYLPYKKSFAKRK